MRRFVQDGTERSKQVYGTDAAARIEAGIDVLTRRYRQQMASATLAGRARLWLQMKLAQRTLRRTHEHRMLGVVGVFATSRASEPDARERAHH